MSILSKFSITLKGIVEGYAMTGLLPNIPPARLEDLTWQTDNGREPLVKNCANLNRLKEIYRDEGDEVIRHLLVEHVYNEKLKRLEYAQDYGIDACFQKYPPHRYKTPSAAYAHFVVRMIIMFVLVFALTYLLDQRHEWLVALKGALFLAGLQLSFEVFLFNKDEYLSRFFNLYKRFTKPEIWTDIKRLGPLYLHGGVNAAELNQSMALARNYQRKICLDNTPEIELGISTGHLRTMGNVAGMQMGSHLRLSRTDLTTSVFVFGETGSGKTTAVILPLMSEVLRTGDDSIAAFAVKGDFALDCFAVANASGGAHQDKAKIDFRVIGPEKWQFALNVFDPKVISSMQLGAMLRDCFSSEGAQKDFWLDKGIQIIEQVARLIDVLYDAKLITEKRTGRHIARAAMDYEYLESLIGMLDLATGVSDSLCNTIRLILRNDYVKLPEKTRDSVKTTISNYLGAFMLPELDNFSNESEISLEDLREKRCFMVFDVPESLGLTGKIIRYLIFQQVYDVALKRLRDQSMNQKRYIHMFVDECQEIINDRSFAKSALSRQAKLCVFAATQSYSQLLKTLNSKDGVNTMLANFKTKVALATTDPDTREYMKKLVGEIDMHEHSYSEAKTRGMNMGGGGGGALANLGVGAFFALMPSMSMSKSKTYTVNIKKGAIRDEYIDTLGDRQALVIAAIGGAKRKEVIDLIPLYLNKDVNAEQHLIDDHEIRKAEMRRAA
jgi:hypothetical protein